MNAMRLQAHDNNIDIVSTQLAVQSCQQTFITKHTKYNLLEGGKIYSLYDAFLKQLTITEESKHLSKCP